MPFLRKPLSACKVSGAATRFPAKRYSPDLSRILQCAVAGSCGTCGTLDPQMMAGEGATVEETSNAMALDGIMFEGVSVRVRRPNDYNPAAAAALGPSVPNANLNLAAIGLSMSSLGMGVRQHAPFVCAFILSSCRCVFGRVPVDLSGGSFFSTLGFEARTLDSSRIFTILVQVP